MGLLSPFGRRNTYSCATLAIAALPTEPLPAERIRYVSAKR